jgi:uncharacterized protein YkwD
MLRSAIAAGALVVALAAVPATAQAAKGCLFQNERATNKNLGEVERSLLCLTNVHRLKNDVEPILRDGRLSTAARAHSTDMATRHFFDHTNPDGLDTQGRATAVGYPGGVSENIATNGTGTALSLFKQWQKSAVGHNENMLDPRWHAAGMGVDPRFYTGGPGVTGTQMFGFAAADNKDDGLDLYASSNKCGSAKLALIKNRQRLRRASGKTRQKLKKRVKSLRKLVNEICKDPT